MDLLDILVIVVFGWPAVLAGVAAGAWGVYRRAWPWQILAALLVSPMSWYIGWGGHLYAFLLAPLFFLLAGFLLYEKKPAGWAAVPVVMVVAMFMLLAGAVASYR